MACREFAQLLHRQRQSIPHVMAIGDGVVEVVLAMEPCRTGHHGTEGAVDQLTLRFLWCFSDASSLVGRKPPIDVVS